jgi:LysR family transcriptional regulator, glycine cleavage system transcriptional activator
MRVRPTLLPAFGVFAAAARFQNFAQAAAELNLTASAVSHHVRRLEANLGVALFQRHARGVALTAAGRALADAANAAIADLDAVSGALRAPARGVTLLRITTLHSLTYCWLVPRLSRFTAAHPNVRLQIDTSIALTRFDDAGPDLGIRHGQGQWPGLTSYYLMEDALFPVASPALARQASAPADIVNMPLVSDLAQQGWSDWFRAAGVHGVKLRELHTFSDSTDAMQAAACGLGAALARSHIAEPYLRRRELVRLPGPVMKSRFSYFIVHPAHRKPSAAGQAFIAWLRAEAAEDEARNSHGATTARPAGRTRRDARSRRAT